MSLKKIVVVLVCFAGLLIAGYFAFDWWLTRAIQSSLVSAINEAGTKQQAQRELLAAYFDCGAGPQDTGTDSVPRTDLLQTTFVGDVDNFATDSKWTVVEGGQKKVSTVHFSVDWFDINHVTIDENVLLLYCRDCIRQIQGDINSTLNRETNVPGRLKTPVMQYSFCDSDTARDAAFAMQTITDRLLSKFIYEDDNDPVGASTIDP
jgi:hypothetical protein